MHGCAPLKQQLFVLTSDNYIVNQTVESFIMQEEGFRSKVYKCLGGVKTIGYGTRAKSDDEIIDEKEGLNRLREYLNKYTYNKIKKYNIKLTNENQLVSVASFDYNTDKLTKIIKSDNTIDCNKILLYTKIKTINEDGSIIYKSNKVLEERRKKEYNLCIK